MNYEGFSRTAPATLGLLNTVINILHLRTNAHGSCNWETGLPALFNGPLRLLNVLKILGKLP